MKRLLCIALAFCLFAAPAIAASEILFIGNSFTYGSRSAVKFYQSDSVSDLNGPDELGRTIGGVPALFKEFTRETGLDYEVSVETVGGSGLDYHLAEKRHLIDKNWDVVVGHGYSTLDRANPGNPALLISSTSEMAEMLAAQNSEVKFYLLATWSRPDQTYPAGATGPWKNTPIQQMGEDVERAYEAAARNAGTHVAGIIPLGTTFNAAIAQGLADDNPYDDVGASKMNLWAYDHYHGSSFGYYLEALMVFGKVTGVDPLSLAGKDHVAEDLGISPAQAQALMRLAHDGLASKGQTFAATNN